MCTTFIFCTVSFSGAINNDIKEQINFAADVLEKSMIETHQGRGSAKVFIHEESRSPAINLLTNPETGETKLIKPRGTTLEKRNTELIVDFVYKGKNSKAEIYEIQNREKKRIISFIYTPELNITYHLGQVVIDTEPISMYFRQIGYDFHPDTFINLGKNTPLVKILRERIINRWEEIEVKNTKDGLFIIKTKGAKDSPVPDASVSFILDSNAFFRPIEYIYYHKSKIDTISDNYRMKWKQYSSEWYIANFTCENFVKDVDDPEFPFTRKIDIKITEFNPESEIKDSEFTLESLNVPSGTLVNDRIINKNYKLP